MMRLLNRSMRRGLPLVRNTSLMTGLRSELSARSRFTSFWFAMLIAASAAVGAQDIQPRSDTPRPSDNALNSTPWYDADENRVIPVHVETQTDDSVHRNSRWLPKAQRLAKTPTPRSSQGSNTPWTWGNVLAWLLLVSVVLVIVAALAYAFTRAEGDVRLIRRETSGTFRDEQTISRMRQLPAELSSTATNLREETLALMAAGHWDAAVVALFGHQLLLLDEHALLRLARGKTNGSYVRETRATSEEAASVLQQTVTAFERSYFGRYPLTRHGFESLWQQNLRLETLLASRREAAA